MKLDSFHGPKEITGQVSDFHTVGSLGVQALQFRSDPSDFKALDCPSMFVALFRGPRRAQYEVAGQRYSNVEYAADDILLVPQNADWIVDFDSYAESLCIFIPPQALEQIWYDSASHNSELFAQLSQSTFRSPLAAELIKRICDQAAHRSSSEHVYLDSLMTALVEELRSIARPDLSRAVRLPSRLDKRQLKILKDVLEERLEDQISSAELAQSLNMSIGQFSEALKKSKGLTPYQYILQHRLACARDLIKQNKLCLAEIAYKTGFSSQAHMTNAFKSKLGLTPGSIRRS